jgi:hypothetical protein
MEEFEKVMAINDAEKDVHYLAQGTPDTTMCGLKSSGSTSNELTCIMCLQFADGDV